MARIYIMLLFICSLAGVQAKNTELKLYRPYDVAAEFVSNAVYSPKSGYCRQQSKKMQREDAWRCEADGKIYDPCFIKNRHQTKLICPKSPWSNKKIVIEVPGELDNTFHRTLDMSTGYPWALETSKGIRCISVISDKRYEHLPVRYQCDDGSMLIGHIQRCDPVWKTLQKKIDDKVQTVDLLTAWF